MLNSLYYTLLLFSAILGAIIGSFLHVVSLRFHTGKSLGGRSHCLSCGARLRWYELIPLVSWIIQRGRCRHCNAKIPFDVFFAELFSALLFAVIFARSFISSHKILLSGDYLFATLYLFVVVSIFLIILFYDVRHKIIPDEFNVVLAILTFVGMFFFRFVDGVFTFVGFHIPSLSHILAGILIPLPFALIWYFSKGKLIGLGDPKLMVSLGFLLGVRYGWSAIFLAFWIGTFTSFILIGYGVIKKHLSHFSKDAILKREVPFAPYLIIATIITVASAVSIFPL